MRTALNYLQSISLFLLSLSSAKKMREERTNVKTTSSKERQEEKMEQSNKAIAKNLFKTKKI